ncbi:MAG: hypothetical protein ACFFDP_03155 [Promethearchaeota archaeon]
MYFDLAAHPTAATSDELQKKHGLSKSQINNLLDRLQGRGLIHQNQDKTYEALAPIEAVIVVLGTVKVALQRLREDIPHQISASAPTTHDDIQQQISILQQPILKLRSLIETRMDKALVDFEKKTGTCRSIPTFDAYTSKISITIQKEVEKRISEARHQLEDFRSIEGLIKMLEKLKTDVTQIIEISLSDMKEDIFQLQGIEEFRETLVDLQNTIPGLVKDQLTNFEQELQILQESLGDLFETKYRLGAFKGVIENFTREHVLTSVSNLTTNFRKSFTENLQNRVEITLKRFEMVSAAAQQEFEKLRKQLAEWIKNALDLAFKEVISKNQKAANRLATDLDETTLKFQEKFFEGLQESIVKVKVQAQKLDSEIEKIVIVFPKLYQQEILPGLSRLMEGMQTNLDKLISNVPMIYSKWRNDYLHSTEGQVTNLLVQTENFVSLASQGLDQVWTRSKETSPETFDLYRFVFGEPEFQSYFSGLVARAQRNLLLILPHATSISPDFLKIISSYIRLRIVIGDDPKSEKYSELMQLYLQNENIHVRHDPRAKIWGALRDFEEILIGSTSKGTANIAGLASSHEEHVELLRSLLETQWLNANPIPREK